MDKKQFRAITYFFALGLTLLIVWYAVNVFLLTFAAILLAILLYSIGSGAKKITHLPYPLALVIALIGIFGILTLIFWLYSPKITDQFNRLMVQVPEAAENLRTNLISYFGADIFSQEDLQKEFSLSNQKLFAQLVSIFSTTLGSITGFIIFLIVGFYLAFNPMRYVKWILFIVPPNKEARVWDVMQKIGHSLRWWLLGKLLSMAVIGILAFIGLSLLNVSLAFILGLLAALLAFIPYVGAILAAIPAILIGFAQSPLMALYVTLLYIGIHIIEGYWITPYIEQKTVSIPPALTILAQVLMIVLIGGVGLALATPLAVVTIALLHYSSLKIAKQSQNADND